MSSQIITVIERWLDSPEIKACSLHATLRFGEEFEQACQGTTLQGRAIREHWIPLRHGMLDLDVHRLKRLAWCLRDDPGCTLANLYFSGAGGHAIVAASKAIPGCVLSNQLKASILSEDIGL